MFFVWTKKHNVSKENKPCDKALGAAQGPLWQTDLELKSSPVHLTSVTLRTDPFSTFEEDFYYNLCELKKNVQFI